MLTPLTLPMRGGAMNAAWRCAKRTHRDLQEAKRLPRGSSRRLFLARKIRARGAFWDAW